MLLCKCMVFSAWAKELPTATWANWEYILALQGHSESKVLNYCNQHFCLVIIGSLDIWVFTTYCFQSGTQVFLYRYLDAGRDMVASLQYGARCPCGYCHISDVETHNQEDHMESFFLAETVRIQLDYLLFFHKFSSYFAESQWAIFLLRNQLCVLKSMAFIR